MHTKAKYILEGYANLLLFIVYSSNVTNGKHNACHKINKIYLFTHKNCDAIKDLKIQI